MDTCHDTRGCVFTCGDLRLSGRWICHINEPPNISAESPALAAGLKVLRARTVKEIQSWFVSLTPEINLVSYDYEKKRIKAGDKGKGNRKVMRESC